MTSLLLSYMADTQNTPKRALTDDLHASNVASNAPTSSATDPDLASQLRNAAMRARRNVSQGYATNKDPLQPGPSSRIKSVSTHSIFRSSNDIMHDVLFLSNYEESRSLRLSRKRACPEDDDGEAGFTRSDESGTSMTSDNSPDSQVANRPIKPLRKPGRITLQTRSLPASLWSSNPAESVNDIEEEEDWSTFDPSSCSKPFEPMILS